MSAPDNDALGFLRDDAASSKRSLGSLGQNMRLKTLKSARWIFIVIGILTLVMNAIVWSTMPREVDKLLNAEVNDLNRQGMVVDQDELAKVRAAAIRAGQLVALGFVAIGVVYLVFAAIVDKYPVPITISGLVIYLASTGLTAMFDPTTLLRGLLIKILIIVGLVKAVQAAIAYQRQENESLAEVEPEPGFA